MEEKRGGEALLYLSIDIYSFGIQVAPVLFVLFVRMYSTSADPNSHENGWKPILIFFFLLPRFIPFCFAPLCILIPNRLVTISLCIGRRVCLYRARYHCSDHRGTQIRGRISYFWAIRKKAILNAGWLGTSLKENGHQKLNARKWTLGHLFRRRAVFYEVVRSIETIHQVLLADIKERRLSWI